MNDNNIEETMSTNDKHKFDKKYLEGFKNAIWNITDESLLIKFLPNPRFNGYIELLTYLKECAEEEVTIFLGDLDIARDESDRIYLKRELEILRKRIVVFEQKIDEYHQRETMEEKADKNVGERNLIYLKSKAGNVLVENDIDDIPYEELENMQEILLSLRYENFSSNPEKYKTLTNNKSLRGIREVKNSQARLYFYHMEVDIILVFLALEKKGNDPKREKTRIISRAQFMYDNLDDIKEALKDPVKREELLNEGKETTVRIEEKINSRKRGGK